MSKGREEIARLVAEDVRRRVDETVPGGVVEMTQDEFDAYLKHGPGRVDVVKAEGLYPTVEACLTALQELVVWEEGRWMCGEADVTDVVGSLLPCPETDRERAERLSRELKNERGLYEASIRRLNGEIGEAHASMGAAKTANEMLVAVIDQRNKWIATQDAVIKELRSDVENMRIALGVPVGSLPEMG